MDGNFRCEIEFRTRQDLKASVPELSLAQYCRMVWRGAQTTSMPLTLNRNDAIAQPPRQRSGLAKVCSQSVDRMYGKYLSRAAIFQRYTLFAQKCGPIEAFAAYRTPLDKQILNALPGRVLILYVRPVVSQRFSEENELLRLGTRV